MSFLNDDTPRRLHSQMNICRICLKYNTNDNPFFDVFTDKLQCLNIYDVLKNLFDINVSWTQHENMQITCVSVIEFIYYF